MAETYTKPLITLVIKTDCGDTFTIADTADDATGTAVWGMVKDGHDAIWKDGSAWKFVPFHSVCSAEATITTTTATKADGFCEEIQNPCP